MYFNEFQCIMTIDFVVGEISSLSTLQLDCRNRVCCVIPFNAGATRTQLAFNEIYLTYLY